MIVMEPIVVISVVTPLTLIMIISSHFFIFRILCNMSCFTNLPVFVESLGPELHVDIHLPIHFDNNYFIGN